MSRDKPDINLDFFKTLEFSDEPVFFDIGSHEGQEIKFFLNEGKAKQVYGFEPHPDFFCNLNSKFKNDDRVFLFCASAFKSYEISPLYTKENNFLSAGSSLCYFKNNIDPSNHSTFTISVDLSDVINSFQNPIDFIKMDAEGVEYQILEKMLNRSACYRVKYIYVEDHSRKMIEPDWFHHRDTVMRQYKQAGFKKISMNEPSNHFCLFKD